MTDYTRKQRDAINRAWNYLTEAASCTDWHMSAELRDALAYERKQRSSAIIAKALLVRAFTQGIAGAGNCGQPWTLDELYSVSRGIRNAIVAGGAMAAR